MMCDEATLSVGLYMFVLFVMNFIQKDYDVSFMIRAVYQRAQWPSNTVDDALCVFSNDIMEEEEDDTIHMGNAIMTFYAALIDLLGRCAPEMHVSVS